jgi:threonine dehydrogenase-like Zn-dependent dehydrogenase
MTLPATNLHAVPASLDDLTAVFIEPTAAACRVIEQVRIEAGMRAAVIGAGRLGLLVAQVLRADGAQVTVVGRSDASRSIAAGLGFDTIAVDSATASPGRKHDVVVDATGKPAGFAAAAALVRPRGTIVLKSTFHGETPVSFSPLVVDEITVVGSRCGPFDRAIELLDTGRVDVTPLVAGIYPLTDFEAAFERARLGLKAILIPGAEA